MSVARLVVRRVKVDVLSSVSSAIGVATDEPIGLYWVGGMSQDAAMGDDCACVWCVHTQIRMSG